ncbi:hypothetical protein KGF56_004233 [Candida oxycetoniae]|uniref:Transcription elongation factor Eaf N-terminal domain-containing protein n=1 Tax=Candida oxycetoniae TaxID=497107 RepID=A0AAI9WW92_9ASCO|nr:uncharacterized protein KGF56_004233 [Candida oxycetoniae]KAI3402980.2 hypothetical protein KGF56_004233 [Candida oxycetoniae]
MSLADGEYDIDLSILLNDDSVTNSVPYTEQIALRYQFIPPSMDHTKPLTLYQKDKQAILKASSTEDDKNSIFFEGAPNLYDKDVANNKEFYLTYSGSGSTLRLEQLQRSIKLNKSRSPMTLQKRADLIEKEFEQSQKKQNQSLLKEDKLATEKQSLPNKVLVSTSSPNKVLVTTSSPNKAVVSTSLQNRPQVSKRKVKELPTQKRSTITSRVSSKRPPTNMNKAPEPQEYKEAIISESDFEDLEDKGLEFPDINIEEEKLEEKMEEKVEEKVEVEVKEKVEEVEVKNEQIKPDQNPSEIANLEAKKLPSRKRSINDSNMELEDDFKDLEDQLQEVLVEDNDVELKSDTLDKLNNQFVSDADDSDFETFNNSQHVRINEGNPSSIRKISNNFNTTFINGKPRSLRDLMGGGKDEGSSSEEE